MKVRQFMLQAHVKRKNVTLSAGMPRAFVGWRVQNVQACAVHHKPNENNMVQSVWRLVYASRLRPERSCSVRRAVRVWRTRPVRQCRASIRVLPWEGGEEAIVKGRRPSEPRLVLGIEPES